MLPYNELFLLSASILVGAAVLLLVLSVQFLLRVERERGSTRYETERLNRLRTQSWTFRRLEPLVGELKRLFPYETSEDGGFAHVLRNSRELSSWTTQEFRATKWIEGALAGTSLFLLLAWTGYVGLAAFLAGALFLGYPPLAQRAATHAAAGRLKTLRLRLPMVVDQLALMIEAGGNFEDSLRTIAAESPQHPLSKELAAVLTSIDAGRSRRDALFDLRERLADENVSELVFAITKGEELGTPLSAILSEQAEQMRLKRSQWGEKAAAEAEVQIVFPGMLVMIACLIVIIAPILLPAAFNIFGD